ncbi:fructosamine kinase family protein [Komagataeibacter sp. FNDCR2]|uniref:fructosamine kinase family protein n=1 Tax=Komagataeibacter sp. FNDCR2 TaxID=2878682 RepID=UPI001E47613A|nr:fructosamine kinase family protein [Komagataeibacter sp. FNDCR2]MCE2575972.1 fructosamine kinase family protein [Komagataeibacter sp. FNDCR2]
MSRLARHGAALLGAQLWNWQALQGGDLARTLLVYLNDGRKVVVKNGPDPVAEADMLRSLGRTGAVVPQVLGVDENALVLQYLPSGSRVAGCWPDLGRVLAQVHAGRPPQRDGACYGWHADYAFGALPVCNAWTRSWPEFWARHRLAVHQEHVGIDLARQIEKLMRRLPDLLPESPTASLLHGDLWGGNVLVADNRVSGLIDPCCHYGHAEVDLATAGIFDRPGPGFYAAHGPLEAGYEVRFAIYRLWIALVHLRLFGATYRPLVAHYLDAAGAGSG